MALNYINTEVLWEEMSGIAAIAISGIEEVLRESGLEEIKTVLGTIFIDPEEDEVCVRTEAGTDTLAELDTSVILRIADEINDFVSDYNEKG